MDLERLDRRPRPASRDGSARTREAARRMRAPLLLPAIALAALVVSCAASAPGGAPAGTPSVNGAIPAGRSNELTVDMHGSARWPEAELTVQLSGVPSDSRCPVGTQCTWPGNAAVEMMATRHDQTESFTLRFGPGGGGGGDPYPDIVDRLGFRFEVVRLDPEPTSGRSIDVLSYRATVRVTAL